MYIYEQQGGCGQLGGVSTKMRSGGIPCAERVQMIREGRDWRDVRGSRTGCSWLGTRMLVAVRMPDKKRRCLRAEWLTLGTWGRKKREEMSLTCTLEFDSGLLGDQWMVSIAV